MDGAYAVLGQLAAIHLNTGEVPGRRPPEDLHPQITPYGTFKASDGKYLNVCAPNDRFWIALCEVLDRREWIEDRRFKGNAERLAHRSELIALLAARFLEDTRDRWIEQLLDRAIPAGPVYTLDEAVSDGYFEEAGMLVQTQHPSCGPIRTAGIPIRLSETPGGVRLPPPTLGEHTDEVLGSVRRSARTGRAATHPRGRA